ncbi:MAG TPA: hypothetical protein VHL57_09105, partial [Flavobacteriales bacterium]|nr:hypothetical protein [Flavobacteriales bacterium]
DIARLNADGSLDTTFDPGTGVGGDGSDVKALVLQADGKIVVGGFFENIDGTPRANIARLEADGALDPTFDTGAGADYQVMSVLVRPDGKIMAGGWFSYFDGVLRRGIVRLNADGSLDPSFDAGFTMDDGTVLINAVVAQNDNTLIIAGRFDREGVFHDVARFWSDGSVDASFDPGAGLSFDPLPYVQTMVLHPGQKIMIAGLFIGYDDTPRRFIARVDATVHPTGLSEIDRARGLCLWPVPAVDQLAVALSESSTGWVIGDAMGRTVREGGIAPAAKTMMLDVQDLAPGLYTMVFVNGTARSAAQRFIVRR